MNDGTERKEIVPTTPAQPPAAPTTLRLGPTEDLDLAPLSQIAAEEIRRQHAIKAVERDNQRETLRQDLSATDKKLRMYTDSIAQTPENASITITNVKDDSLGRTEIITGNTEAAHKGKLSRSQTGFGDNATFWFVLAGIIGAVVVLVAIFRR